MPKVETRKARNDIYERGILVPDAKTKSGFRKNKSEPHQDGDKKIVEKGQTYYTWSFNFGPTFISMTYPKRSQLTQSSFLGQVYDIEDRIGELSADSPEDLQGERDELVSELESLLDETQDSFDNMPDGLQQGDTGQLLEERVNGLDEAIQELKGLYLDYEEPDEDDLKEDVDPDSDDPEKELEELKEKHLEDWLEEKLGELKEVSIDVS